MMVCQYCDHNVPPWLKKSVIVWFNKYVVSAVCENERMTWSEACLTEAGADIQHMMSAPLFTTHWAQQPSNISFEVIGRMLATHTFSHGRHQMGKHYNLAAISI